MVLVLIRVHDFVLILGVDDSSSAHVDILILGEGPTQGLDDATITTETNNTINFTRPVRRFVLSLRYNEAKGYVHAFSVDYNIIGTNDI